MVPTKVKNPQRKDKEMAQTSFGLIRGFFLVVSSIKTSAHFHGTKLFLPPSFPFPAFPQPYVWCHHWARP